MGQKLIDRQAVLLTGVQKSQKQYSAEESCYIQLTSDVISEVLENDQLYSYQREINPPCVKNTLYNNLMCHTMLELVVPTTFRKCFHFNFDPLLQHTEERQIIQEMNKKIYFLKLLK